MELLDVVPLFPYLMIATAIPIFIILRYLPAPYAKLSPSTTSHSWGPPIPAPTAWFIQEVPSLICSVYAFTVWGRKAQQSSSGNLFLLSLYIAHYLVRVFVFPFLMRDSKPTPLVVLLSSFAFCIVNGLQQGYAIGVTIPPFPITSLSSLQLFGVAAFIVGFLLNQHSDHILRSLRAPGDTRHYIPHGGLFQWVTAANYTGEFIEWCGYAIACQTMAGVAFAVFTFANLAPRAVHYQQWYIEKFPKYPRDRKAIIPLLY